MTHRIEINATTGETKMVEYTAYEQATAAASVEKQQEAAAVAIAEPVVTPESL